MDRLKCNIRREKSHFSVFVHVRACVRVYECNAEKYWWTQKEKLDLFFWFFKHIFLLCSFFQRTTIETKNEKALKVHVNSDANTILAPIGRSTWLCTITHNNNKNWSHRRCSSNTKEAEEFAINSHHHRHQHHHHHRCRYTHTVACARHCFVTLWPLLKLNERTHWIFNKPAPNDAQHHLYSFVSYSQKKYIYYFILSHWCVLSLSIHSFVSMYLCDLTSFKCAGSTVLQLIVAQQLTSPTYSFRMNKRMRKSYGQREKKLFR